MPLNTGDRIFPYGGSPGGGGAGSLTGGPWTAVFSSLSNCDNLAQQDAQYTKSFKMFTGIVVLTIDVLAAGTVRFFLEMPQLPDSSSSISGFGSFNDNAAIPVSVIPAGDGISARISFTADTNYTNVLMTISFIYKTAA